MMKGYNKGQRDIVVGPRGRPIVLPPAPPKLPGIDEFMILAIVGARKRAGKGDKLRVRNKILELKPHTIVTGDCKVGADRFARYCAKQFGIKLMVYNAHIMPGMSYGDMVKEFYKRNDMVARTATHMYALPNKNGKGGTIHTIKRFKAHHKDWETRLFIE